jgi:hypothetical protein
MLRRMYTNLPNVLRGLMRGPSEAATFTSWVDFLQNGKSDFWNTHLTDPPCLGASVVCLNLCSEEDGQIQDLQCATSSNLLSKFGEVSIAIPRIQRGGFTDMPPFMMPLMPLRKSCESKAPRRVHTYSRHWI